MDQQTFRSTTNPSAAGFSVKNNAKRLFGISRFVNVDVNDAFEVGKDRHASLALDETDKALATTRDDHVDIVDSAQHCGHGLTVTGRDQLDRIFGQFRGFQARNQTFVDCTRRMETLGPAAQDHCITRFQT